MVIKAINFDFYGTIVDWVPVWTEVTEKIISDNDLNLDSLDLAIEWRMAQRKFVEEKEFTWYKEYIKMALDDVCAKYKVENKGYENLLFEKWKEMQPFEEVGSTLLKLKEKYPLAVCSNSARDFLDYCTAKLPINFDYVNISDETKVNKPHKKMYDLAQNSLGYDKSEILHVASSQMDVKGATEAGFVVAWINRRGQERFANTPKPSYEIRKLDELLELW
tara:strand:- start:6553 stop:7212 length:660 start_codon:yes stop_codon:yes gene_type:complete